jgi:hypothetical protein
MTPEFRTLYYRAGSASFRPPSIPDFDPLELERLTYDLAPYEHTNSADSPDQVPTD